jgi:16S rRNA C967 or C1407 C5-methylase (RsmB/RsmF family)
MSEKDFYAYYETLFGDQWGAIWDGLHTRRRPILRFAPENEEVLHALFTEHQLEWELLEWFPHAVWWPKSAPLDSELPGNAEHLFYVMSPSSLVPVLALDPQPHETLLDACAAPGGKALFIADYTHKQARLTANDTSPDRRRRMQDIFFDYNHGEIRVSSQKAETLFKQQPDYYDRILLDAPCSSEMHVVRNQHYLDQWTPGRSRSLQYRQIALLSGLFEALKPGGRIVYSTCAVTPEEDEKIVAKFLKKKKDRVRQLPWTLPCPGPRILPHTDNLDPMFVAIFERVS